MKNSAISVIKFDEAGMRFEYMVIKQPIPNTPVVGRKFHFEVISEGLN